MFRMLISGLRSINIKVFYTFMTICVIPVTLVFSPGAHLTLRYYHRRRGYGWWKALVATYRNHCIFGQTVIDKFAMYAGHKFRITYNGLELYREQCASDKPLLLLSAHMGCSEILGYSVHHDKPCNVLVYGGEKQSLMSYRRTSFSNSNIRMIPVGTATSHSDEIISALDNGEIISAFADRFMNANKVLVSTLHGFQVSLAKGPFSLATTRGIDVMMMSSMKEPDGSYSAFFTPLPYDRTLPKSQQRQQLADAYTTEIERLLAIYPLQWFNYSNIWICTQRHKDTKKEQSPLAP